MKVRCLVTHPRPPRLHFQMWRAGISALLFAVAIISLAAQSPTVRVPVRLVVVPTLVLSADGRAIAGLDAAQFRLFDNGQPQNFSLDPEPAPLSAVFAIQSNDAMPDYLPQIAKTASVIEDLLLGANGSAAVLSYNDEVKIAKPFASHDLKAALSNLPCTGRPARLFDAADLAIALLKTQPPGRSRILILIGQPYDRGSTKTLADVRAQAEAANIQIYGLVLPLAGRKFVADTFHFPNMASQKGGVAASVELTTLIPAVSRAAKSGQHDDPFSQLASATGGTQIHFRKQAQLENALIVMGGELRSTYSLSYTPASTGPGHRSLRVQVTVPGAKAYTREGYDY